PTAPTAIYTLSLHDALPISPVEYHPWFVGILTRIREPDLGQSQAGSLTGAVASQKVTEAPKGSLSAVGNRARECKGIRELDCETDRKSTRLNSSHVKISYAV